MNSNINYAAPDDDATRLTAATMASLHYAFATYQHSPSAPQWQALEAIAQTLAKMAVGTCPAAPHLSTLDPGVGKTTVMIHFLKVLMASPYRDAGVLICIGRKDQLRDIVDKAALDASDYAFLTADDELNERGLGTAERNKARVLFTTHRQIELRVGLQPTFAGVEAFHYRGKPRAVRVWDEALLPSLPLTISRRALGSLFAPLERPFPACVVEIEDLHRDLEGAEDGYRFQLPDLESRYPLQQVRQVLRDARVSTSTAESLWMLSGRYVTVRKENGFEDGALRPASTMLDYRDHLPDDLWPILILDASGRVRTLYRYWQHRRTGLVRLEPDGAKSYAGHTVHIMKVAGSKSAWRKRERAVKLAADIAATVLTKPAQKWLIVHHKAASVNGFDLTREIEQLLPAAVMGRVKLTTWGRHDASNEWKDIPNVILAGLLYLPKAVQEARGRCAAAQPSSEGEFVKTDLDDVIVGEFLHDILQAMCRGKVRECLDGACPPDTHTYIMARPRDKITPTTIKRLMPGCTCAEWIVNGVDVAVKGRAKEAIQVVLRLSKASASGLVSGTDVMSAMEWPVDKNGRADFKDRVRDQQGFQRALYDAGLEEVYRGHGGKLFYQRVASPFVDA